MEAGRQQMCGALAASDAEMPDAGAAAAAQQPRTSGSPAAAAAPAAAHAHPAPASSIATAAGAASGLPSSSVLVQTAALPPLQLLQQQAEERRGRQGQQQQRVVQTGAVAQSPNHATEAGGAATPVPAGRSPLPATATSQQPQQGAKAPAVQTPPSARTPPSAKAPAIDLFKPMPKRAAALPAAAPKVAASGGARCPAEEHPLQQAEQLHRPMQLLPGGSVNPIPFAGLLCSSLQPGALTPAVPQPGSSGAFLPFSAAPAPPAWLTAPQQPALPPLSPFIAERTASGSAPLAASAAAAQYAASAAQYLDAGTVAASAAAASALFGGPLPALSVPSWSGSNISSSSSISPFGRTNGSGDHAGARAEGASNETLGQPIC